MTNIKIPEDRWTAAVLVLIGAIAGAVLFSARFGGIRREELQPITGLGTGLPPLKVLMLAAPVTVLLIGIVHVAVQYDVGFWLKFSFASAVVGPLVFLPPLWAEYRTEQIVGFIIGLFSWGFVAALLMAGVWTQP